jgi:acyl-CoA:acyl-CoA alkyltransferase
MPSEPVIDFSGIQCVEIPKLNSWREQGLQIASIAVRFPSLKITNADLLERIAELNPGLPSEQLRSHQRKLEHLMVKSGCDTRYYRNRSSNETAIAHILDATKTALMQANLSPNDIDLLIYCGVGRGFLEPAMAYFVANALGINCACFDVLDACMSWVRALAIADGLFRQGAYRHIAIVNGEFNIYECGYPELLTVDREDTWSYTFPAFTIGEAASVTILNRSDATWNFHFRSDPSRVCLCTLPLPGYADFSLSPSQLARNGTYKFMSFGMELSRVAIGEMSKFARETYPDLDQFDILFPHAASAEACRISAEQLGLGERLYNKIFSRYGNLVSASIPAAMSMALEEGALTRGSRVVLCPASAGMSFALVDFVF